MRDLVNSCTVFDSELRTVGKAMVDRFQARTGGTFQSSILNNKAQDMSTVLTFLKRFGGELQNKLRANGGNINTIPPIAMGDIRPTFNGIYNKFHGLQILVNDTELTEIRLNNFETTPTGTWVADVTVTIYDHFGLDKADALKYQGLSSRICCLVGITTSKGLCLFYNQNPI